MASGAHKSRPDNPIVLSDLNFLGEKIFFCLFLKKRNEREDIFAVIF